MFSQKILKSVTISEIKRFVCSYESNYRLLTQYFGLHNTNARAYIQEHRLLRVEPANIMRIVEYCKEIGFNPQDLLQHPILLRINPITFDQYYSVMLEGGFKQVTPAILAKFRTLNRKSIQFLKEVDLIDQETDVASSFINHLNPRPDNFNVEIIRGDEESWADVHFKVLAEYLKWRLKATNDDIVRLAKVHPCIHRKSFKYLCENIAFAEEIGFTPEKMLKYGYILHAYPKYTTAVLEKFPLIAGASMKKAMRMFPKLISVSPSSVEKIYNILKEHNIPDVAIEKRMNIFHLSPETVKLRLEELERVADLKVLMHHPNVLKLVVHHNRAKSRLSFLKQLQLKCSGVSVLGNDDIKFDNHVREGRDSNTSKDIYSFLKGIFNKEVNQFDGRLKKHPYYLQIPLVSMEDTYNYLKTEKFTSDAIFQVIYILLYPKDKIKDAFKHLEETEDHSEHHFTGDGVWTKNEVLIEESS